MAMYDPSALYVDPILTNFSVGFQDQGLIGRQILPEVPVNTQSGRYNVFDRSNWLIYDSRREPGTVANEIRGRKWSTDHFSTQEHSLQASVVDEENQQLNSLGGIANPVFGGALQIDPHADAAYDVAQALLLSHEKRVLDLVTNTATYPVGNTVTLAGNYQWDQYVYATAGLPDTVYSNPVSDIQIAMRKIWSLTKRWPNTIVFPILGSTFLENHPRIVRRFENFALTNPDAFRALTGFQGQILFASSVYNASNNVYAAETITDLWGKDVWVGIVDPTPALRTKTFGKTFCQVYPDGSIRPTERWREENRKADLVRTSYKWDVKVVSSIAGYLIKNAFSSGAW